MIELTNGCIHHYRISRLIVRPPLVYHDLADIQILFTSATKGLKDYALQALVTVTLDRRVLIKIFAASKGPYRLSEEGRLAMTDKIQELSSKLVRMMF